MHGKLRDRLIERYLINLLDGASADVLNRCRSGDDDKWGRRQERPCYARDKVDCSRPVGRHANARSSGGSRVAQRHESGPLLVSRPNERDVGAVVQGVQNLDIARPHQAKDVRHPFDSEGFDDSLPGLQARHALTSIS